MDNLDFTWKRRAKEEPFPLPEGFAGRVLATCTALEDKTVSVTQPFRWWIAVAAAVALFIAIPNFSAPAARAMEKIPVLGAVVQVITLRNYTHDDDHTHAAVSVPQIQGSGTAAASVNEDVQAYTGQLIKQFQADCAASDEAYEGLDVSYDVVTDSDTWFTLRIDAVQTQASGYQFSKIYNIDKATDNVVPLSGLFQPDSAWQTALSDEVRRQMETQMADPDSGATYFMELFTGVKETQNYYFNSTGDLVLAFDEYDIAPGSMGAVEFTISKDVYQTYLK